MAASCASCATPTETGIRCGPAVLCPGCAARSDEPLASVPAVRPALRAVALRPPDAAEEYAAYKEMSALVEGREQFHRAVEKAAIEIGWLQFQAAMVLLVCLPAALYVRFEGLALFGWAMVVGAAWTAGRKLLAMAAELGRRRQHQVGELSQEGAYRRYRKLQEDMKHLDVSKQRLLKRQILPKLRSMMEEKLPYLMQRRYEFASFLKSYRYSELEEAVGDLERRQGEELDEEVREALGKRLELARARRDHFKTLSRRMRLYSIHLGNLESHMENLVARVVMLDPNDDFRRATERIMQGLTEEVEVLEEAYQEVG